MGMLKKSIAANHANCANRKNIEKANKRVKNEPASGGLVRRGGFAKFAAIQGFFNSPPDTFFGQGLVPSSFQSASSALVNRVNVSARCLRTDFT